MSTVFDGTCVACRSERNHSAAKSASLQEKRGEAIIGTGRSVIVNYPDGLRDYLSDASKHRTQNKLEEISHGNIAKIKSVAR